MDLKSVGLGMAGMAAFLIYWCAAATHLAPLPPVIQLVGVAYEASDARDRAKELEKHVALLKAELRAARAEADDCRYHK
jgi:hypothetical protein